MEQMVWALPQPERMASPTFNRLLRLVPMDQVRWAMVDAPIQWPVVVIPEPTVCRGNWRNEPARMAVADSAAPIHNRMAPEISKANNPAKLADKRAMPNDNWRKIPTNKVSAGNAAR